MAGRDCAAARRPEGCFPVETGSAMRMSLRVLLALLMCGASPFLNAASPPSAPDSNDTAHDDAGRELLGTRPPEWQVTGWLHTKPLTLASLRGKVVLIRWWTGPQCGYCAASADALNALWHENRDRGLVVIGMYHHKTDSPLTRAHVQAQARRLDFQFPIAIDENWVTLHSWWLDNRPRGWTSVTFVLDREGRIRHIHPGGAYRRGEPAYAALAQAVADALQ